ncbi:MAG TPA: AarF/UbiB family protein [Gemmatimonadales bacterium]|nr:AarF/UbiB family protein [Gemmatimonadales bacterium]
MTATEPAAAAPAHPRFEPLVVTAPPGYARRMAVTVRHFTGLLAGGLVAWVRRRRTERAGRGFKYAAAWLAALVVAPLVRRDLRREPFPVQLRRRLELLGPTYIKLGQILSLREDILPVEITDELKRLLSHLPAAGLDAVRAIVERDLGRSMETFFAWVDPEPLGSASIAQTHRATTREGDPVVLKVVKPGIRETLQRDARLLAGLGVVLQALFPRYQPRQIIREFTEYTLREVDLRREADNAETFAANFKDAPDIAFPQVYRQYSGKSVLCMEYFEGLTPDTPEARALPEAERRRVTELGASAIIRMLYHDGFFHADLHPGNLMILPGNRVGFIDLGMVGRLDEELRRTLLYYYYSLVMGDPEAAARYLTAVAEPGPGGDPHGFRREVTEISQRWKLAATFDEFSLARLILESVTRGAEYRMYFPVEMVLMVKALVTFEGVGNLLMPGLDVAELSRRHIRRVFIAQFSPVRFLQEGLRGAPDVVDAMVKMPLLLTEGLRVLEKTAQRRPENPLAGMRATLLAGAFLVTGGIVMALGGPWPVWAACFLVTVVLGFRKGA